jgi:hypothetical protein
MADKTKSKRLSKSERTHQRRLKQAARQPGSAASLQLARVQRAAAVKKEKGNGSLQGPAKPPVDGSEQ